jgi:hypothetical protein
MPATATLRPTVLAMPVPRNAKQGVCWRHLRRRVALRVADQLRRGDWPRSFGGLLQGFVRMRG